jgi:RNA 3'-terminal phosphate cyclase (ATP)
MLEIQCERITETFTGFGQRGVPAERVAEEVVSAAKTYLDANVPVGKLLADQLILPFAIAASRSARESLRSSFKTLPLSSHAETNIEVVKKFLDVDVCVKPESEGVCIVEIAKAQ